MKGEIKGDRLLIRKGRKVVLEKLEKIAAVREDELADLSVLSEESMKGLWLGKGDEVWNQYLLERKK